MTAGGLSEAVVEDVALGWPASLGYSVKHGPEIASSEVPMEQSIGKGS